MKKFIVHILGIMAILICVVIFVITLPLLAIFCIYVFIKYSGQVSLMMRITMIYVNIALGLPTIWLTENEIREHILRNHINELDELEAMPHIDDFISSEVTDGTHQMDLRSKLLKYFASAFFGNNQCPPLFEKKAAYFHPTADRLMLNPTGEDAIGRTFKLPSFALSDKENALAQNGESIELAFVRKQAFGSKNPPKAEASKGREFGNVPGALEPSRA